MRIAAYNKPCYLLIIGLFGAAVNGSIQPFVGVTFGKLMTIMTTPEDWATLIAKSLDITRKEWFTQELNFWVIGLAALAFLNMFSAFAQKLSWSVLGGNVTYDIRKLLYGEILTMNVGWFDNRENSPSVLSAIMAKDTSIINGVSTESVSPSLEGGLAFLIGCIIGFYFSWEMSCAMILVSPIMAIGGALEMQAM